MLWNKVEFEGSGRDPCNMLKLISRTLRLTHGREIMDLLNPVREFQERLTNNMVSVLTFNSHLGRSPEILFIERDNTSSSC